MQENISKNNEVYLPVYKYAKLFNVTKQTIYRWIKNGKIKKENIRKKIVERIEILAP